MRDKAGFFAGLADILTELCLYYIVAAIFIMSRYGWGVHLGWLLAAGAACGAFYAYLLRVPRNGSVLTAVTAALIVAALALFLAVSTVPLRFGYVLVLAIGAGMAVGLPLYYSLRRPLLHNHLTHLDALLLAMLVLLIVQSTMGIDNATVALTVAVLLMDAAAAVGLRMTGPDGAGAEDAPRASLVAMAAAAVVAGVIWIMSTIFSRSGGVTSAVFHGLGSFFAAIGGAIERFFRALAALLYRPESYEALPMEDMPSIAAIETQGGAMELSVNTTAVGIVLVVLLAALAIAAAVLLRKKSVRRGTNAAPAASDGIVRRRRIRREGPWARWKRAMGLRWLAFQQRNTPAGLLIGLERLARRRHVPRQTGETMRAFLARMEAPPALADALDTEYYGGHGRAMSPRQCRQLRKEIRRVTRNG